MQRKKVRDGSMQTGYPIGHEKLLEIRHSNFMHFIFLNTLKSEYPTHHATYPSNLFLLVLTIVERDGRDNICVLMCHPLTFHTRWVSNPYLLVYGIQESVAFWGRLWIQMISLMFLSRVNVSLGATTSLVMV